MNRKLGIPMELRLLLQLTKMDIKYIDRLAVAKYIKDEINWDEFLRLAIFHRVFPIVYGNLIKLEIKGVPQTVLDKLKNRVKRNNVKMMMLTSELSRLTSIFNDRGIDSISAKGPAIGMKLYKDISLRPSKDLDIVVRREDIRKAEKVLLEQGYLVKGRKEVLADSELEEYMKRDRHFTYFHPKKKVFVELHWNLFYPTINMTGEFEFEEFWETRQEVMVAGQSVNVISDENLFRLLLIHGVHHRWFRLRWLHDMVLMNREHDFLSEEIQEVIRDNELEDFYFQMTSLIKGLFDEKIAGISTRPSRRARRLEALSLEIISRSKLNEDLHIFTKAYYIEKIYSFELCRGFEGKRAYLKEIISPRIEEVEESKINSHLYPIHFILRFTNFFSRQIRKITTGRG